MAKCVLSFFKRPNYNSLVTEGLRGLRISPKFCRCFSDSSDSAKSSDTAASNNSSSSDNEDGEDYELKIKHKILAASLPFVHEHGWTKNAISAGAESIGYAGVAHGMFPRQGAELVQYFCTSCNNNLASHMKNEVEISSKDPVKQKKPPIFIQDAVEVRLLMVIPYLSKWPQALAIQALPPNVPVSLANLLTLVDDICYYAGDRSVDFNWYSRRIALAGIYKMAELYLIQDKSQDFKNTWQFLERRMEEAVRAQEYLRHSEEFSQITKEAITATFITARNILGMNR